MPRVATRWHGDQPWPCRLIAGFLRHRRPHVDRNRSGGTYIRHSDTSERATLACPPACLSRQRLQGPCLASGRAFYVGPCWSSTSGVGARLHGAGRSATWPIAAFLRDFGCRGHEKGLILAGVPGRIAFTWCLPFVLGAFAGHPGRFYFYHSLLSQSNASRPISARITNWMMVIVYASGFQEALVASYLKPRGETWSAYRTV